MGMHTPVALEEGDCQRILRRSTLIAPCECVISAKSSGRRAVNFMLNSPFEHAQNVAFLGGWLRRIRTPDLALHSGLSELVIEIGLQLFQQRIIVRFGRYGVDRNVERNFIVAQRFVGAILGFKHG